jgi:thymidylate synthase
MPLPQLWSSQALSVVSLLPPCLQGAQFHVQEEHFSPETQRQKDLLSEHRKNKQEVLNQ